MGKLPDDFLERVFRPVSRRQTLLLALLALAFGAFFVNYAEYSVFLNAPPDASPPPAYHLWLEVLYVLPFLSIALFRGACSLPFVYVLGRIASLGNDFGYPVYAKYIAHSYDGSISEWWIWMVGLGSDDKFSWVVNLPFVEYEMTSSLMGINLAVRLVLIASFFYIAHRVEAKIQKSRRDQGGAVNCTHLGQA